MLARGNFINKLEQRLISRKQNTKTPRSHVFEPAPKVRKAAPIAAIFARGELGTLYVLMGEFVWDQDASLVRKRAKSSSEKRIGQHSLGASLGRVFGLSQGYRIYETNHKHHFGLLTNKWMPTSR